MYLAPLVCCFDCMSFLLLSPLVHLAGCVLASMRMSLFLYVLLSLPNSTMVWSVICDCSISWLFSFVIAVSMSFLASGDFFSADNICKQFRPRTRQTKRRS